MTVNSVPVVIASVPWTDTDSPLMAPAALKGALAHRGITSVALDLNQEVRQQITPGIADFFITQSVTSQTINEIEHIFGFMVDRILSYNPEWICLSLLTYLSQHPTRWLCFLLKQRRPDVKIVIGGAGCFNSLKGLDGYVATMRSTGLINYYVSGDGEISLPDLILGQTNIAGVNETDWKEVDDLDSVPMPDYSDYPWELYPIKRVSILGSRGCVRQCTFCDIHEHWSKFQWRSAESIFEEMKSQYLTYGINIFSFADSLINGNQKEYRKLIRLLAEFNRERTEQERIRWTSFFIFRPQEQMNEDDWRLTAESGALLLLVGVESFVDHIRQHLKKKFSNQDIEYSLAMGQKYDIKMSLLMIVGYVTETEKDHQEQLQWIRDHAHLAGNPIQAITVGNTLAILPGTELYRRREELGVVMRSEEIFQDWENPSIGSTPELRLRWLNETLSLLRETGFSTVYNEDNHVLIEQYIKRQYAKPV